VEEGEAIDDVIVTSDTRVPRLVGLPIKDVIQVGGLQNLKLTLEGSGVAVRQYPAPGEMLDEERRVKVEFVPAG
jgi:hypothetical protein